MSEVSEITFTCSIMPCRIMQDASIRTTFTAALDGPMNAVQAVLTEWMMEGKEVEVTIKPKGYLDSEDLGNGRSGRKRTAKKG